MNRRVPLAAVALCLVLAATGCTGEEKRAEEVVPALTPEECPADIRSSLVGTVECARLTVPESRGQGATTRPISVFVTTVRGPEAGKAADPMLVAPGTGTPNYKGLAPLAQRVGRDVIIVDGRGVAHSDPALDCPGVDGAAPDAWARPTGDRTVLAHVRDAVAACHEALTAAGVDVASFDVSETAADLVDLRELLGLEEWNLISYGATSRTALELLRQDPDHVRSLVMDSPEVPGTDPRVLAAPATERAVRVVLRACAGDPSCRGDHPQAAGLLDEAITRLAADPLPLRDPDGGASPTLLDPGLMLRGLRESMSNSGNLSPTWAIGSIPDLLSDVVAGRSTPLGRDFGQLVGYGTPTCLGYRATCLLFQRAYLGTELTRLCRDIAPFSGRPDEPLGPGYAELFGASPYWDLCDAWPVPAADSVVDEPPQWDGPALVVLGAQDPYTDPAQARRALAGLTSASYVVSPARGHNALPAPCAMERRNAWMDEPTPFRDNPCAEEAITWTD